MKFLENYKTAMIESVEADIEKNKEAIELTKIKLKQLKAKVKS